MSRYLIGIDTGGTFTDAVIIDAQARCVLATAKSLTTKGNYAVGVQHSLSAVLDKARKTVRPSDISLVSISTTLATNAVVEGHGSRIAVVLAGFDEKMVTLTGLRTSFPDNPVITVAGGHDHNGNETAILDTVAVADAVRRLAPAVDAFAVAAAFAVRNAAHEIEIGRIITGIANKPFTLSSELTSSLDAPRRAATAALNARLISRIAALIRSVKSAMDAEGVNCPLMIVKGDGSLATAQKVVERPIETVLSGPAASLIGAKWLSGRNDFILSDIGGTTTDVAILEHGLPKVAAEGASVGGWRTMVKAIDVRTTGLGGDTEVKFGLDGAVSLEHRKVVPISLLAQKFPAVLKVLAAECKEDKAQSQLGRFVLLPFETEGAGNLQALNERERELLAEISAEPKPIRQVAAGSIAAKTLDALIRKGAVHCAAFSPSDAAHVLGLQDNWSHEGARLAAVIAVRNVLRCEATEEMILNLCRDVWSEVCRKSARCVLDIALPADLAGEKLVDAVCRGQKKAGRAAISIVPDAPLIGVGGPAPVFYPEVARRLGSELVILEHGGVANAAGAAVAQAAHRAEVVIEGDGSGVFRIFDGVRVETVQSGALAIARASDRARARVEAMAIAFGNSQPEIELTVEKQLLPDAANDDGLLTAQVVAQAVTAPALS
jgi:N-methylhydantoinase A/oxoprolinase/acetone carboxylase beta subunit